MRFSHNYDDSPEDFFLWVYAALRGRLGYFNGSQHLPYESLPTPTREGYLFKGWFETPTGGQEITVDTTFSFSENRIVYAHWTPLIEPDCNNCGEICCDYCDNGTTQCADPVCRFCYPEELCGTCNICKSGQAPTPGYVLGNDTINIADALEILKYMVRLSSVVDKCNNSFKAAMVISVPPMTPNTADALEILKFIVGMKSVIQPKQITS